MQSPDRAKAPWKARTTGQRCAVISLLSWEGKPPSLLLMVSFLMLPNSKPHWLPILTGSQGNQFELDFKPYPPAKSFSQTASHPSYLCSPFPPMNPPFVLTKWTWNPHSNHRLFPTESPPCPLPPQGPVTLHVLQECTFCLLCHLPAHSLSH